MRRLLSSPALLTAVFALCAAAWAGLLSVRHLEGRASVLDRIESVATDLRVLAAGERPAPSDVVIVAIDDETVTEAASWAHPRDQLGALIRRLSAYRPKALALDVLLIDPGPNDSGLAEALKGAPTVIAAAGVFGEGGSQESDASRTLAFTPSPQRLRQPAQPFLAAAQTGLVNLSTDHGGTPRHVPLLFRQEDRILPSFALLAAAVATGESPAFENGALILGSRRQPLDLGFHLPLRFYGPRGAVRTVSAMAILRSEAAAAALAGRILVVGVTAVGSGDTFATPFDSTLGGVSGVEVLATAIANLITGDGLIRTAGTRRFDAAAAMALAVGSVLLLAMRRAAFGLILFGLLVAGWGAGTVIAFIQGYWLSVAVPLASVLPSALLYAAARLWLERRRSGRLAAVEKGFRRFHSPILAERLARDPGFLAEPLRVDAAVVFLDLSGYTLLSEELGPDATRDFLKTFHAIVERETNRLSGLVISFMGDGAMLLFGFPDQKPDDARRALDAIAALDRALTEWLSALPGGGMRARFGAHYGTVVVSRLGAETHQHITATGDTVNVASRLMEVAKANGVRAAASDRLCRAAGEGPGLFGEPVEAPIRGRAQPLKVRLQAGGTRGGA